MTKRPFKISDLVQKKDGDTVTLPTDGRPYLFACCGSEAGGCDLVHSLYTSVDDAGKVTMQVYREDEMTQGLRDSRASERADDIATDALLTSDVVIDHDSGRVLFQVLGDVGSDAAANHKIFTTDSAPAPRKVHKMRATRRPRYLRAGDHKEVRDSEALDESGLLRDGYGIRFSMTDAETSRAGRTAAVDTAKIDEAKRITQAVVATQLAMMQGDGSREHPYILGTQFSDAELARHKPGYRFSDDTVTTEEEHHQTRRKRRTVYRDPQGREQGTAETADAMNATEQAYSEMLDDLQNGWKKPPVNFDATATASRRPEKNAVGRALEMVPPRGGYFPASAGVGSTCNVDGVAGTLQPAGVEGQLYCRPSAPIGATRVDSMTAEQAAPLRDAAYQEMCAQLRDAWRG
jgi:hypothetical protein